MELSEGGMRPVPVWKDGRAFRLGAGLDLLLVEEGVEEDLERRKFESEEDDEEEMEDDGGLREAAAPRRPGGGRDWLGGGARD